ncbi:MAG: MmgE/PrpD family protein [bacterium]|nr:MmgE/PrpD family protein [bacterium]
MAAEGYEGPVEVIEGKEGFQHVIHNVQLKPEILLDGLGTQPPMIRRCGYKAFPTEALTHQPMSAVLGAMQENGLKAEDLASIHIQTTTRGADILSDASKYDPQTRRRLTTACPTAWRRWRPTAASTRRASRRRSSSTRGSGRCCRRSRSWPMPGSTPCSRVPSAPSPP